MVKNNFENFHFIFDKIKNCKRFKNVKDLIPSCKLVQTCFEENCTYYTKELY